MKIKPIVNKLIVLMLIVSLFCACSRNKELSPNQDVLELSAKKFNWLINQEYDSLDNLLDEQLRYIHSNGLIETKEDVFENMQSGKLRLRHVQVHEAKVRYFDNSAIVIGNGKFMGVINEIDFDVELLYTEVYINKKGKWLLVSRHANRLS